MRISLFASILLFISFSVQAQVLPQVRVGMLQFGTAHWELSQIQAQGLDTRNGYKLVLKPLANTSAGSLALTSGSVDWIVSDWIWGAKRTLAGDSMRFIPFSTSVGELVVPTSSTIATIKDLIGKRIGVAGGPQGKSWRLLEAIASRHGIDLRKQAHITFAAPPLLSQELKQGRLDALLTFWHFAARLKAEGAYRAAFTTKGFAEALGLDPKMPMLGYIGHESWVVGHPKLAQAFAHSIDEVKQSLLTDAPWQQIRPLMRANSDAVFDQLKQSFRQGEPASALTPSMLRSAAKVWSLTGQQAQEQGQSLPLSLFRGATP